MAGLIKVWPVMAAVALLAGCDGGASAVPVHQASATAPPPGGDAAFPGQTIAAEARAAPARPAEGRLAWSSSRRFTSGQNAERNFRRNGAAFGATSLGDYVAKAHAFIARPPRGAQTLTRRNGDTLIYDPASNVFAVATREGAPRTMFKPDEGAAYWERVKTREAEGGARRKREEG